MGTWTVSFSRCAPERFRALAGAAVAVAWLGFSCGSIRAQAAAPDPWVLTGVSPDLDPRFAATLANGFIGAVIPALGAASTEDDAGNYFLDGYYEGASPQEAKAQLPRWNCVTYHDGRNPCRPGVGSVSDYRQQLFLHDGTLETNFRWTDGDRSTAIRTRTFVSRADPHLAVLTYAVTPDFDGPVELQVALDGRKQGGRLKESGVDGGTIWMRTDLGAPTRLRAGVAVRAEFTGGEPARPIDPLHEGSATPLPRLNARFQALRGQTYTATVFVAVVKAGDPREAGPEAVDVAADARERARRAADAGAASLLAAHLDAWHDAWKTQILLDGDGPQVAHDQEVIRSCLFALLQNARPDGVFGQDPMGFTNSQWSGAVFWDDNFFAFPVRQLLYPALAMPSLRYRMNRLDAARAQAAALGGRGAAFPWVSRYDGRENARAPYNQEIHVSGEVAWAQWLHYQLTRDVPWLRQTGWPIIRGVADFVVSRAVERHGRYEVLQVLSPDEYAPIADNDAYTNAIFRRALEIAVRAAAVLGEPPDPRWRTVARGMYLPFDETWGVYAEYDGYAGKRTKQAGVELLLYPLELPMAVALKRRILDFYGARVDRDHGPGMTAAFYAIAHAELGDTARAYASFARCIDPFIRPPFDVYSETPTNDATDFLTAKAATLLAVIHGFAGVRVRDDGVHLAPRLPAGWRRLTFTRLPVGGAVYDVELDAAGGVRATRVAGTPDIPLYDARGRALK